MPTRITKKVYEAISFERGASPQYDNLISSFIAEGLLINNKGDMPMVKPVHDYVAFIKNNIEAGHIVSLTESEIVSRIHLFGNVGHIISQYQLDFETSSEKYTKYGINLFQIIKQGSTWKIASMCWDDRDDTSLFDINI